MKTDEKQTMTQDDRAGGGDRWLRMVFENRAFGRAVWPVLVAAMLTACGDDGNGGGNEDTLLTGLSGVVILGAVIWFALRKLKSRS